MPSLDRFRGFALALMIIFGAAKSVTVAPVFAALSTHDLSEALIIFPGIGFYDLIAPLFVFACGLGLGFSSDSLNSSRPMRRVIALVGLGALVNLPTGDPLSFVFLAFSVIALILVVLWFAGKKTSKLDAQIISRILRKFVSFVGLFALATAVVENVLYLVGVSVPSSHWSVLASIGVSALFVYPFTRVRAEWKLFFCAAFTALYFAANLLVPAENFSYFTHGGLLGSFGWGLMCLYAATAVDLRKISKISFLSFGACLCVSGFIIAELIVPSKSAVSLPYVLITSSVSLALFGFFDCFNRLTVAYNPLSVAGKNSLFMYLVHLIIFVPMGTVINALLGLIPVGSALLTPIAAVALVGYFLLFSYVVKKINGKGFRLKI